jgi:hypothetical protein
MLSPRYKRSLSLLSLLLFLFLVACTSENEDFIQGYWYRGNVHFMDQWLFDQGRFSHEFGATLGGFNNITGRYQVIDVQDDSVTLELFDMPLSFGDERTQIGIKLDWESDTIRIRSQTFDRIIP